MTTIQADEIYNIIRERIEKYNREVKIVNTGTILQVGDGITRIHGLDEVMAGELVKFDEGTIGIALNLESNNVSGVLMGDGLMIQDGTSVKATGKITQVPASEAYLGRVINALAKPIDGRVEISASEFLLIDSPTPCIISRHSVYEPLQTGLITIDSMFSIGRDSPAALHYLAPYIRAKLAEYFMYHEQHTLIMYDDLSKQAQFTFRQRKYDRLLIVETQSKDISVYFPTNVISITDGQIFLYADLFNYGIRPAINGSRLLRINWQEANDYANYSNNPKLLPGRRRVSPFLDDLRKYIKTNKPQFKKLYLLPRHSLMKRKPF
ncbi:hypothetical protein V2J09_006258 [Rumex salicifolius]